MPELCLVFNEDMALGVIRLVSETDTVEARLRALVDLILKALDEDET